MNYQYILFLALIGCLLLYFWQIKSKARIKKWLASLNLSERGHIFNELYKNIDGFSLSRQARQNQDAPEFVYGEIEFIPFIALLSLAKPNKETVFYDLGSGTGKAVIACALVYPVKKCVGIELFPQLHESACSQLKKLKEMQDNSATSASIEFILGDYFNVDFDEATMIFINSTALFGSTWENLCKRMDSSPQLNTVITTSKPLVSTAFTVVLSTKIEMSWGIVFTYIHTRKN